MESKPAQQQVDTKMPQLGLKPSKRDLKLKNWESHREEICEIYVMQGNTLRKTMQFMREKYNFQHR
jgi:hypothetical protein